MGRRAEGPPDLNTQHGRLRWAREARGYPSARIAAAMIRVNENTYKSHEYGKRKKGALTLEDAQKYAKAFRVNLAWLMTGQGSPFDDPKAGKSERDARGVAVPERKRA